jgi:hypothetical protein
MVDARGGIVIEPPLPPAVCYACGGEITLSDDMRAELRKAPGARMRHEECPSAVAVREATLRTYRVTTVFERIDEDPFGIEPDGIPVTLMTMSHQQAAADLTNAWDGLCIGVVAKWNTASMHTGLAEAEALDDLSTVPTPDDREETRVTETRAAADPQDYDDDPVFADNRHGE